MQSHRTLSGPDEILSIPKTFRDKKLPCDALIYLGTEFTPSGWNTRNGEFGWKKENFPDPKTHGGRDARPALQGGPPHRHRGAPHVGDGVRVRVRRPTPCRAGAMPRIAGLRIATSRATGPYHKPLYDLGIDGWWPDQGDGLDLPSRLVRHRMYWEGSQQWRPNERPFALHRNGAAGMQRYGAFLWSGDVQSRWETLKTHVPIAVNTGPLGYSVLGHRHRRVRADGGVHRRAARPLVSVRRVLSVFSRARPALAPQAAVGLERRRRRSQGDQRLRARARRAQQSAGRADPARSTSSCAIA